MPETPIAIITGSGSGIGRATAFELAARGWRCALVGRRRDKLEETAGMMQARNPRSDAIVLAIDIAAEAAPESIVRETTAKWGSRIDALINNAAVVTAQPIHSATDDALRDTFEVNAFAPMRLVRSVWPIMSRQPSAGVRGRIINISSMAAIDPFPGLGVYGMSKSALEGLTRAINNEGREARIIAFSIVLGPVETEMLRSVVSEKLLPRSQTRDPADIATVIADCAGGQRDRDAMKPIVLA